MRKFILISSIISIITFSLFLIIIIPSLITLSFFSNSGEDITDEYVLNNSKYTSRYIQTLNNNLYKGYIPLNRILYFYNEDNTLTFDEIYNDNLDKIKKKMLPISKVCVTNKYKNYLSCSEEILKNSKQVNIEQNKPFNFPTNLESITITSFFMEQRNVGSRQHGGFDLAGTNNTPVYSPCDGVVKKVSFPFNSNIPNYNVATGNTLTINCKVNNINYDVIYMHLYPNSNLVKVGQEVVHFQKVASIGNTGYSTGSHLHYEVRKNNKKVDGMSLIDFNMKR